MQHLLNFEAGYFCLQHNHITIKIRKLFSSKLTMLVSVTLKRTVHQ